MRKSLLLLIPFLLHADHYVGGSHALKQVYVSAPENRIWEYGIANPQDVWPLSNGNILVAWLHGVKEISPAKEVVWEYTVQAPNEVPSCQPLPDGGLLIGVVGECRLIEFGPDRKIRHEVRLATTETRPHAQFRMCRKTAAGTYLVPFTSEGALREYSADGRCIRTFASLKSPVCAERLPNGNTLVTGSGAVIEYDANNTPVWQVNLSELPGVRCGIPAGTERLANGNTRVCNWNGSPSVLEISPDKQVVGHFTPAPQVAQFRNIPDSVAARFDPQNALPTGQRIYADPEQNKQPWDESLLYCSTTETTDTFAIKAESAWSGPPLTLTARVRTNDKKGFNIFAAFEPKGFGHWELYSYAGSGTLAFYIPGNQPAEIRSQAVVADGQDHEVGVEWTSDKIRLLMDGRTVAEVPYNRETITVSTPRASIGRLVEGGNLCNGKVAEVRINGKAPERIAQHTRKSDLFPSEGNPNLYKTGVKPPKGIPLYRDGRWAGKPAEVADGIVRFWSETVQELHDQISGKIPLPRGAAQQVYDANALIRADETTPLSVILRRTEVLLANTPTNSETSAWRAELDRLRTSRSSDSVFEACALRRKIMLSNPRLAGYTNILFLARATYAGCRLTNPKNTDRTGGHFATQCLGFNTIEGGGLFVLENFSKVRNLLDGCIVTNGPYAGRELDFGSFYSPEVGYDGTTVYFAHCNSQEHVWKWTDETVWKIFKFDLRSKKIAQLTFGPWNDFDPVELPAGRIVFISERRGAFIRCFTEGSRHRVPTFVLHSMKPDGSDIYPISYYETSEWHPSVDNNGRLVYTRWDYTDREDCLGSQFWTCYPDGRDPRAPHGNYPFPWHTFEDNTHGDHRFGRCADAPSGLPMAQMHIRAMPDSGRYLMTFAPHHGESFGTLGVLDLRLPDDYHFGQLRRITPYSPLPESEMPGRTHYKYGTAWPVSDGLYLANRWEDLVLIDQYGNEELLCDRESLPLDGYDPRLRLTHPKPLAPRIRPPVIPRRTAQGVDFAKTDKKAVIGVVNVNITDQPFPSGRKPTRLRVFQVIPKHDPWMDKPFIGYGEENTPRVLLGTVPLQPDGSALFEAPAGKLLIFQVLDENNMAIQTMRSAAFVHPGEQLTCLGCHEPKNESYSTSKEQPLAFRRKPAVLEKECGLREPISYNRQIKPIVENRCAKCHIEEKKGPQDMSFAALRPYVQYFSGGFAGKTMVKNSGGSRSIPGRCGAGASKLAQMLLQEPHLKRTHAEDRHLIYLWLDANAPRYGAYHELERQEKGELVWPLIDTDPNDPLRNLE